MNSPFIALPRAIALSFVSFSLLITRFPLLALYLLYTLSFNRLTATYQDNTLPLLQDIRSAVAGAFCAGFTGYDRAARWSAGFVYPERVDTVYPTSPAGEIAATGIGLFCDRPPDQAPPLPTGGQCTDTYCLYVRVVATLNHNGQTFDNGPNTTNGGLCGFYGPIGEPYIQNDGPFPFVWVNTASQGAQRIMSVNGMTVTSLTPDHYRQNGLPDNCTGEPPDYPPLSNPADRTFPITINNGTGQIVFGNGNLNVNGNLSVPFRFDAGGIELSGELELNTGDINLNFGSQPTDPLAPAIPTPDFPPPPGEDDDDEGGPANIIGAIVVATQIGDIRSTQIAQIASPDIYAPKIGEISFKVKIGDTFHWTQDSFIKNANTFVPVPTIVPAVRVSATPLAGWELTVVPVRGIVPAYEIELI